MKTSSKTLHKIDPLPGSVCIQFVRCGRPNCRCRTGQENLHGPYFYHFWREKGRLKKRYVKASQVEVVRAACNQRREDDQEYRLMQAVAAGKWRLIRDAVRRYDNGEWEIIDE